MQGAAFAVWRINCVYWVVVLSEMYGTTFHLRATLMVNTDRVRTDVLLNKE